jgi:hypothetical protein
MSGGISIWFVDFAVLLFDFNRVCCGSFELFLVRNWCGALHALTAIRLEGSGVGAAVDQDVLAG